ADRYGSPPRVTFAHVFVSSQRAGADVGTEAIALKGKLDEGADPATLGDPFLRGREFRLHSQAELASIFGAPFADAVMKQPDNTWSDPIRSTFGLHIVRVTEKRPGTEPVLANVRDRVEREWREERPQTLNKEARARL